MDQLVTSKAGVNWHDANHILVMSKKDKLPFINENGQLDLNWFFGNYFLIFSGDFDC